MNAIPSLLVLLLFSLTTVPHAGAALPPLTDEEREQRALLVITGHVEASRVLIHRKPSSSLYFVRLKALVEDVEKGGTLTKPGEPIDIRCWRIRKSRMNGPGGHSLIPAEGSRFRMWLIKNKDGHWEPLQPNGIDLLDDSAAMGFAEVERKEMGKSYLIGGIVGATVLIAFAIFRYRRRPIRT